MWLGLEIKPSTTIKLDFLSFLFGFVHVCVQLLLKANVHTMFMSMPLVYVHACWKYSSSLCLNGLGIWWKRMNSFTRSICMWYRAVPEYSLWIIADTFPKMLAYINAGVKIKEEKQAVGIVPIQNYLYSSKYVQHNSFQTPPPFLQRGHWKGHMPLATYINLQKLGNNDCPN